MMKRFLLTTISILCFVSFLMAQGKTLGKVTAVTEDKNHSGTGTLIQYTDAYGKTYLELEIYEPEHGAANYFYNLPSK